METFRRNIIANFGGQATSLILSVALTPLYLRTLGVEAFGLIGFYMGLQAIFSLLDLGLSATLNRELARQQHLPGLANAQRDLVRTLEWIYWPMGVLIALLVYLASGPIATSWLNPEALGEVDTARAIVLMGVITAVQWPAALYSGGLRGLERQVGLNLIVAGLAVVRAIGSVVVLLWWSPTLEAFLLWQLVTSCVQTILLNRKLWGSLPTGTRRAHFQRTAISEVWTFTLHLTGISALSFLLMQSDKLILSKIVSLESFGYYALAGTVAASISTLVGPFFNASFPRYSALVGAGKDSELGETYHRTNQFLAVAVGSLASMLAIFSYDLILLWTGSPTTALQVGPLLSVLVIGTALNGLMHLPYALQLANGWTHLALYQNLISVVLLVPAMWIASGWAGGLGVAWVWAVLNMAYVAIGIPVMHRRLLKGHMTQWYLTDLLPPIAAALATAAVCKQLVPLGPSRLFAGLALGFIGVLVFLASAFASPATRGVLLRLLKH